LNDIHTARPNEIVIEASERVLIANQVHRDPLGHTYTIALSPNMPTIVSRGIELPANVKVLDDVREGVLASEFGPNDVHLATRWVSTGSIVHEQTHDERLADIRARYDLTGRPSLSECVLRLIENGWDEAIAAGAIHRLYYAALEAREGRHEPWIEWTEEMLTPRSIPMVTK
jgi:hypothetical protein